MPPSIHRTPGIHVEESGSAARAIAAVATSICAFAGRAPRGPPAKAVPVSSFAAFEATFGAAVPDCPLGDAVRDFFEQGGTQALVLRLRHGGGAARGDEVGDDAGPALDAADYLGDDGNGGALSALRDAGPFDLLCLPPDAPGADTSPAVYQAALALCVDCRAILLVDAPAAWDDQAALLGDAQAAIDALGLAGTAARNAALYYPRLAARVPGGAARVASGAVAGVFARIAATRGIWKSPAGPETTLSGIEGLSAQVTDAGNDVLNRLGINCLRMFPGRPPVLWGARTLRGRDSLGDDYKYVPVRRLALFIERSVSQGIGWAVFEPNAEPLWAQLRRAVGGFLEDLFRQGAFPGRTSREAWFVRCDATTVSARDLADGVCNVLVGFAPLKPAEFIVLRFAQATQRTGP